MKAISMRPVLAAACLLSACTPWFYHFDVIVAKKTDKGVEFAADQDTLVAEDLVSICYEARQRTWRRVRQCIVHERVKHDYTAYAFTGAKSGRVFMLAPHGIDTWRIVKEDTWITSPKDYVRRIVEGEPNHVLEGTAR